MKTSLRRTVLAILLALGLCFTPIAFAQAPGVGQGLNPDQEAGWFSGLHSWWDHFWSMLGSDSVPVTDSSSTTTDPDSEPETTGEGETTGGGDWGPGLDPMG